jgi:hypothetical protein
MCHKYTAVVETKRANNITIKILLHLTKRTYSSAIILNHINHRLAQTFRLVKLDASSTSFSNKKYKFIILLQNQSKKYTVLSGQKEKSSLKFDGYKHIRRKTTAVKFNNHLPKIFLIPNTGISSKQIILVPKIVFLVS